MKDLQFETISKKKYTVKLDEGAFLEYTIHCGYNLNISNQLALYLNNLHHKLIERQPFDSVWKINYEYSKEFIQKYNLINETLKYNI